MKSRDKKKAALEIEERKTRKEMRAIETAHAFIRIFELTQKVEEGKNLSEEEKEELENLNELLEETKIAHQKNFNIRKRFAKLEDTQDLDEKRKFYEDAMRRASKKTE